MAQRTDVLYNADCPICNTEVSAYRAHATAAKLPVDFDDLNAVDLAAWNVDADTAARRLHVRQDGKIVSGLDAFLLLWRAMPKYRWLARLIDRPVIRPLATAIYDHVLAPILYALHRRRQRRRKR